jgi:hypothetical protein
MTKNMMVKEMKEKKKWWEIESSVEAHKKWELWMRAIALSELEEMK